MAARGDVVDIVPAVALGKFAVAHCSTSVEDGVAPALEDGSRVAPALEIEESPQGEDDSAPILFDPSDNHAAVERSKTQMRTGQCSLSPAWARVPGHEDVSDEEEDTFLEKEVEFVQNCYTLVLVSRNRFAVLPAIFITVGQIAVLYMIVWRSPEYLFAQGRWITPISMNLSLDVMKVFALMLVLFQVAAEFEEAGSIFTVLVHRPLATIPGSRFLALAVVFMQYAFALLVILVAVHLVLSCQRPIEPLWKSYYVFMTLNFDNMLCKFIVFALDLTNSLSWKVTLQTPCAPDAVHNTLCAERFRRWLFVCMPVAAIVCCATFSLAMNISPITFLRYGYVTNTLPALMMTSDLGLPAGCCRIQVEEGATINVSTPFLSALAPEDMTKDLSVYWVVWSTTRDPPSSLQIMEGRGGDGTPCLQSGFASARPLQMREWLLAHSFPKEVFDAMVSRESSIGLYRSSYAYVAEWTIPDFPRKDQAKIFAVALNGRSGALSPIPIDSQMLSHSKCPDGCEHCGPSGLCYRCRQGFTLDQHSDCRPCAPHCERCQLSGPGACDRNQCSVGSGLVDGMCRPCGSDNCKYCDEVLATRAADKAKLTRKRIGLERDRSSVLPCLQCNRGYGLINGVCLPCQIENCHACTEKDTCDTCAEGYVFNRSASECRPCAEHCASCTRLGEGECDPLQCASGYGGTPSGRCEACSGHCLDCREKGGGSCDPRMCKRGYGLHGNTKAGQAACHECIPKCKWCDQQADKCDACIEGYGLTPEGTCKTCESNCKRCNNVEGCDDCIRGFVLQGKVCLPCADRCESCNITGPGLCNERQCAPGWATVAARQGFTCRPCVDPRCSRCDSNGPDGDCDDWFY
mmetsp:Transcript_89317/g.251424  ORF Transcript_89317/g.251424 Transcript_89317/m.251424 type:complete len:859 (-) Transcript_89317:8-2584(-)